MEIGKRIRKLRLNAGYSQERLAEMMDITTGAVSKWENDLSYPDINKLVNLASIFHVSVDYILNHQMENLTNTYYISKLKSSYENHIYDIPIAEINQIIETYPNDFAVIYQTATYLQTYAIEKHDFSYFDQTIELIKKAISLFYQNTDKDILRESLDDKIIGLYILVNKPKEAVEYINKQCELTLLNKLNLGICHFYLGDYEMAKLELSDSFLMSIIQIINGNLHQISVLFMQNHKQESMDLCKWMIDILSPLDHNRQTFLAKIISLLYAYLSCIRLEFNLDYDETLKQCLAYTTNNDESNQNNNSKINFFYREDQKLYTNLSGSIDLENMNIFNQFVVEDQKYKIVLERYLWLKERHNG